VPAQLPAWAACCAQLACFTMFVCAYAVLLSWLQALTTERVCTVVLVARTGHVDVGRARVRA
jgi:hypothetical protein